eukprot:12622717-Ditylum_brightwellii.AAC.2
MVEMLLRSKILQYWQQFKSQATRLLILGVLDEEDEESSRKEQDDKEKGEKDKGHTSTSAGTPAGITKDTYSSSMQKFVLYYFVNHHFSARAQKHYLWNFL